MTDRTTSRTDPPPASAGADPRPKLPGAGPAATPPFIPSGFDPADFAHIEPLLRELLDRRVGDVEQLRRWVMDLAALMERIDECGTRRYIDAARHTDDPDIESAYLRFVREVEPKVKPLLFRLQQRYLRNPQRHDLYEAGFAVMELHWQADVDIYREENIPLQTRQTELANDYSKLTGAMTVAFRGRTLTLQQLARFLEAPDRPTRQEAWEAAAERRLRDRDKLEAIFDELLSVRCRIARNAGFDDFRGYCWRAKKRFDYGPDDCLDFARAVERLVIPIVRRLDERRRNLLGLDTLRPWDTAVDPLGRPPLRPFDEQDIDGFVRGVETILRRIAPDLADQFRSLADHGDLDLESRPGKRPGGFQAALEAARRPFIFMNAAGVHRDVDTLLHEAGHAFHYLASSGQPNLFVRHAPLEFCEVASMSMELLGCGHYDAFYPDPADAARARRRQIEDAVRKLPWIALIDSFQHWLYTHPDHDRDQRDAAWLDLLDRFSSGIVDYTGYEPHRRSMWHRQIHLFHAPFYYIEYGIAQLGALQVWLNYRKDAAKALRDLRAAFALGGARPLPELFSAAGLRFDFSERTIQPLLEAVAAELDRLPA